MTTRNPLGLGLVIVGAVAIALGAFLPFQESPRFGRIEQNHLIQNMNGWVLVALALGILVTGYRAGQGLSNKSGPPIWLSLSAAADVVNVARDKSLRTLYPIGLNGEIDTSHPGTVAELGIAIYVAGAGAVMAFIGALMIRQAIRDAAGIDEEHEKQHGGGLSVEGASTPKVAAAKATPAVTKTTTRVRCNKCQHTQQVPVSASTFQCEECGAKLTRAKKS